MEPGDAEHNDEADGSASTIRVKVADLESKLRDEKARFDLLQLEACQEVEKYARECLSLRESLARREEDCSILRERELRDRDRIMGLLEEIDMKERLFKDKFVDLKDEIRALLCAGLRANDEALEWRKKYLELEERFRLRKHVNAAGNANGFAEGTEDEVKIDDEMPKRDLQGVDMNNEDMSPIGEPAGFNDIGDKMKPPRKKLFPRQVWIKRKDISEETLDGRANGEVPVTQASWRRKVVSAGVQSYPRRYSRKQKGQIHKQRIASFEKQLRARDRAEIVWSELTFCHPSFVKSMIRSHVSSCFWLCIPAKFCKDHLPDGVLQMVLQDEEGLEHYAKYIGARTCLSGGWKGFALAHNLEVGDALVFELIEPAKFKVYIIKANNEEPKGHFDDEFAAEDTCRLPAGTKMLES